ncbi:hypothetical protein ACJJTC_017827 [Scirpophaga incertulas]
MLYKGFPLCRIDAAGERQSYRALFCRPGIKQPIVARHCARTSHMSFFYVPIRGEVARRDTSNLERLVVTGKIEGKRPRGRSPKRWSDQIVEELQIPVSDALHQATERDQWRRLVDGIKRSHDPQ